MGEGGGREATEGGEGEGGSQEVENSKVTDRGAVAEKGSSSNLGTRKEISPTFI